ncbi:MAG TPA: S8 family serine peptidase, partial [Bacillota bacterium]|nr:S8 family serine peptidase [Bacillota bacterium]
MKRLLVMLLVTALLLPSFAVSAVDTSNPFSYLDEQRSRLIEGASSSFTDEPVFLSKSSDESSLSRCIVKFSASLSMKKIYSIVAGYDFELLADSSQRLFLLYVESADAFAAEYAGVTDYIETDAVRGLEALNDTYYSKQWQYEMYDFDAIWSVSSGSGVTVAVIDSGINRNHEDLTGANILSGYNAVTDTLSVTADTIGHGTAVAGIIAAVRNNSKFVAGICSGVAVLPVAVTRANGEIYSADFIKALYFAADSDANIINMSFAGEDNLKSEQEAINYANAKGCILIGASGNYDSESGERDEYSYPASYEHVISVTSFGDTGALSHFSCYNDKVDIAAPGEDIYVIYGTTNTAVLVEDGTSFAAPFVSAVAALALSVKQSDVEVSSDAFASLLTATASASTSAPCGNINPAAVIRAINDPIVTGIVDGGVYFSNVTVSFNLGLATLDGEMFASGTTVKVNGTHTLVITYGNTVSEYNFTTDNLPLTYSCPSGNSYSTPISIVFKRGTATLNGTPYYSGKQISESGYYTFILTGPNGNTAEKTFTMHTDLPVLYGAENGAVYTHAVELSIIGDGTATVGSKTIKNGETMLISDSGSYTVTLRNVGGTQTKTVAFTVDNEPDAKATLELLNALLAVDADNSNVYVYGTSLYGVRVYDAKNLGTMLRYVTTGEKTVLSCVVSGSNIALMHSSSISLMDGTRMRSGEPLRGTVQGSGTFKAIATDSSALYALLVSGSETKLVRINTTQFRTETLKTFSGTYDSLVWAQESGVFVITDGSGKLIKYDPSANTAVTLTGFADGTVYYTGGVLYIGGSIYDSSFKRIAVVSENGAAVAAFGGMLIYTNTVADALTGETLGKLSKSVITAAYGGGSAYLLYYDTILSKYICDTTARSLGCAEISNALIGDNSSISDFSSLISARSGMVISDWVHSEITGKLYIIFKNSNYLYILDDDFSSQQAIWINERPTALAMLGTSVYIGLENSARLGIYNGTVTYMTLTSVLTAKKLVAAQDSFFCLSEGNVYYINAKVGAVVSVRSTGRCDAIAYDNASLML